MALPTYHCLECEKDFKANGLEWECTPGQNHRVKAKRYYMADAPTVAEWRDGQPYINKGASRCTVLNIPPERRVTEDDEVRRIPGGSVEFVRGLFETDNPELQFYLDKKEGLCTEARWNEVYLNDEEKHQIERMKLTAERNRLEADRNELLAQVKKQQAAPERKKPGPKPKILRENPDVVNQPPA